MFGEVVGGAQSLALGELSLALTRRRRDQHLFFSASSQAALALILPVYYRPLVYGQRFLLSWRRGFGSLGSSLTAAVFAPGLIQVVSHWLA